FVGMKLCIVAIKRRAIRANHFGFITHVEKHMRMIERRVCTDAHEFLHADFDGSMAGVVLKVRNDVIGHNMLRFWSMGGMDMDLCRVPDKVMHRHSHACTVKVLFPEAFSSILRTFQAICYQTVI